MGAAFSSHHKKPKGCAVITVRADKAAKAAMAHGASNSHGTHGTHARVHAHHRPAITDEDKAMLSLKAQRKKLADQQKLVSVRRHSA
jgi:hypothetical protein